MNYRKGYKPSRTRCERDRARIELIMAVALSAIVTIGAFMAGFYWPR